MKSYAQTELGVADEEAADRFATAHADFVQLTTAVPPATDSYWQDAVVSRAGTSAKHPRIVWPGH